MNTLLIKKLTWPLVFLACWSLPMQIFADDAPIVAGKLWGESSTVEKKSYLLGAGNFISLEYEYQSRTQQPPTPEQSSVPDFFKHTDQITLDQAIQAVDEWYQSNPGKMATPVLTVLWDTLVEPNL